MSKLVYAHCVLLVVVCAPLIVADDSRPPWSWPVEERIQQRLHPENIAERLRRHAVRRDAGGRASVVTSSVAGHTVFVIDGVTHPELFLPWELFERLLNMTVSTSPHRDQIRSRYAAAIVGLGWEEKTFWTALDEVAVPYMTVRGKIFEAGAQDVVPRRNKLAQELCESRAAALDAARERLGNENFDRFLYTTIAPNLVVYSDEQPMTASDLRTIEKGCRR